ncbi:hypothetical protein AB0F88_40215 [Streptosporangium sp. NPDC023963]|uniref:hypothetical protein n=1 Tax=Streptosporangium sp. NPDC023963 TaxID=3155608 RepID=UPI003449CA29
MGQAKTSTQDLSRQMQQTGAYADAFRQRLEAATKTLPKITIDADSSPAEIKFAELRAQMEALADKKIGIDISSADAVAQIREIQRELEQLQRDETSIDVKADIGSALSELQALNSEVERVDGRTAHVNVNANVGGALANIALVGAALAALPAATTIGVGVAGLGAAFTAAGVGAASFAAVAVPGMTRVNEALKAQESAAKAAGGATGGAGQSAAQAAQQAMQLEQAERRLKDAQTDARSAQEDLTRAREAGRRALEDMNFSLDRSILSEKDAALAVKEAAARLAEVNADPKASDLERERAALSYEQALQRVEEQEVKTARAKKDTAAANKAGIEGTKEYQRGLDDLKAAQDKVAQAEDQLKQLHLQQQAAMSSGGGAAGKLKDAFADLSKEEKALAKDTKAFSDAYLAWQRGLQPDVFPVISQGLGLMERTLPKLTPMVQGASGAFGTLLTEAEAALAGPFWTQFLNNVAVELPGAILGLGRSFGNVTTGVAGIIDAFLPFTPVVVGGLDAATTAFSKWGQQLNDSPEFHEFLLFVKQNAPDVWELIKNLASALVNVGEAVGPLGIGSMAGLNLLAQIVAGMDPQHIQLIALAIVAIKTAQAGLGVASFFTEMPGKLDRMRDGFDRVKGKTSDFGSALTGLASGLGGVAGIVGGAALVGGLLILESRLSDNAKAATEFQQKISAVAGGNVDAEIAALTKAIADQRAQIGFAIFDTIYFSDAQREAADKVESLESRLGELKHQKELDAIASKAAGDAAGEHGRKVGEVNAALDTFAGKTDAYQAIRNMEQAYKDASAALQASNGKLSINKTMTDAQRDAVIAAREKFAGYTQSVKDAADGAAALSGKTSDGTKAVLEQLPRLGELAGKSSEAKSQILLLAQAYGISAQDAQKAMKGGKDLKEVLAELKSKSIKIDMDTKTAQANLDNIKRTLIDIARRTDLAMKGGLNSTSARGNAWGGIQNRNGAPDYMAQGGIRSLGGNPSAMIARKPYHIAGRGGPDVVFGEAGYEAFIPLDSSKRARGLQILQEAAGLMGMAVVPEQVRADTAGAAAGASGGSFSGSAGGGAASVTVTGIDALHSALTTTALNLTGGLAGATSTLDATLGDAGTLTQSLTGVGEITGHLADEVTGWGEVIAVEVPPLTEAVTQLGDAISAAASGDSKGNTGSKGDERSPRSSSAKKAAAKKQPVKQEILGATSGTVGVAMPGSTNWSRTSRPVQSSYSGGGSATPAAAGGSSSPGTAAGGSGGAPVVAMYGATIRSEADLDELAARVSIRRRGRG